MEHFLEPSFKGPAYFLFRRDLRGGSQEGGSHLGVITLAPEGTSQVIHNNAGTARGEEESIGSAEAASSAGNDDNLSVKAKSV
jgi:hypothetical protein